MTQVAVKTRGPSGCAEGRRYLGDLRDRWRAENATLARLTGWDPADIRQAMVAHCERTRER